VWGRAFVLLFKDKMIHYWQVLGMESPDDRPGRADDSYRAG